MHQLHRSIIASAAMPLSVMLLPNTAYSARGLHHSMGSHYSIFFPLVISCEMTENKHQVLKGRKADWNHFVFIRHKSGRPQNKPQAGFTQSISSLWEFSFQDLQTHKKYTESSISGNSKG